KELKSISVDFALVTALAFSSDSKLLAIGGSTDKGSWAALYDVATGNERHRFTVPLDPNVMAAGVGGEFPSLTMLLFAPDGRTLTGLHPGNYTSSWDVTTGRELPTISVGENQSILAIAFSPDGRSLAVECGEQSPRLYETATGRQRHWSANKPETPDKEGGFAAALAPFLQMGEDSTWSGGDVAISPDGKVLARTARG